MSPCPGNEASASPPPGHEMFWHLPRAFPDQVAATKIPQNGFGPERPHKTGSSPMPLNTETNQPVIVRSPFYIIFPANCMLVINPRARLRECGMPPPGQASGFFFCYPSCLDFIGGLSAIKSRWRRRGNAKREIIFCRS